jgi:hypothetical protein
MLLLLLQPQPRQPVRKLQQESQLQQEADPHIPRSDKVKACNLFETLYSEFHLVMSISDLTQSSTSFGLPEGVELKLFPLLKI